MRLALAGDTMLGRGVAEALHDRPPESLFAPEVVAAAHEADLFVLNLECCISTRGRPWGAPGKPFFFRSPPDAVAVLTHLGVDCVTLANNHALDYSHEALMDTFEYLSEAGIVWVGAGDTVTRARAPAIFDVDGMRLAVIGVADHPSDFEVTEDSPGIAFADLHAGFPRWLCDAIRGPRADAVLVTPHWGPNMIERPLSHVRRAAQEMLGCGATLIAGHSAHVFHGVAPPVLFDLGDFIDDYAVDPELRNDLGLLWLADLDGKRLTRIEALPLALDFAHTRPAVGEEARWVEDRLRRACAELGTEVSLSNGRLVVEP